MSTFQGLEGRNNTFQEEES